MQATVHAEDHDRVALLQQVIDGVDHLNRRHCIFRILRGLIHLQQLVLPTRDKLVAVGIVVAADRVRRDNPHALEGSFGVRSIEKLGVGDRSKVVDAEQSDAHRLRRMSPHVEATDSQSGQGHQQDEMSNHESLRGLERDDTKKPLDHRGLMAIANW